MAMMMMMPGITNKQVSEVLPEDVRSASLGNLAVEQRERIATEPFDGSNGGAYAEERTTSSRPAAAAAPEEEEEGAVSSSKRIKTAESSSSSSSSSSSGPAPTAAPARQANFRVDSPAPATAPRSPLLHTLPPVPETPYSPRRAAAAAATAAVAAPASVAAASMWRERAPSPAPSTASSSAFSAATTTASSVSSLRSSLSSRASLSSSRSCTDGTHGTHGAYGRRGSKGARGSSDRSYSGSSGRVSAPAGGGSGAGFFPPPPSRWGRGGGGSGDGVSWRRRVAGRRERSHGREREVELERRRERREKECRRWPRKDYASEAGVALDCGGSCSSGGGGGGARGARYSGRKRSRSCSRERGSRAVRTAGEAKCKRCMERCRVSRERKPISRTLPMDYWVRTAGCKAAKSKHIEYIDNATYSREQFIEETVFTCPETGERRDIVLERNMFPYDVPTDVEHWTLWSRHDLTDADMQEFVQNWAACNHPHVVEWECDNNEGDRSIDWFHVHVFFRVGCEDRTGLPRDPESVYDAPCRKKPSEGGSGSEAGLTDGEESAATDCE